MTFKSYLYGGYFQCHLFLYILSENLLKGIFCESDLKDSFLSRSRKSILYFYEVLSLIFSFLEFLSKSEGNDNTYYLKTWIFSAICLFLSISIALPDGGFLGVRRDKTVSECSAELRKVLTGTTSSS